MAPLALSAVLLTAAPISAATFMGPLVAASEIVFAFTFVPTAAVTLIAPAVVIEIASPVMGPSESGDEPMLFTLKLDPLIPESDETLVCKVPVTPIVLKFRLLPWMSPAC
jgi:hypothetical protein